MLEPGSYEEREHIIKGQNLQLLPQEFVGSWNDSHVLDKNVGSVYLAVIRVVDTTTALAILPAATVTSTHYITHFAAPLGKPRTLLEIPTY